MNQIPSTYAIIPARYNSSRFPGKPLATIMGKPMFWHVYSRAKQCPNISAVFLATDDERIYKTAQAYKIPCLMTSSEPQSGTDRVVEAIRSLNLSPGSIVINIQGDEPTIHPSMLTQLIEPFYSSTTQVTTLARLIDLKEAQNPNVVKIVCSHQGHALYFSRSVIPYIRDNSSRDYWAHIGIYGFRVDTLEKFSSLSPSPLEKQEQLEQLRLLEIGIPIRVVATSFKTHGIDTPEDLKDVEEIITKNSEH